MSTFLRVSRTHHTTFAKIPVRGNFTFDPATPYLAYGGGVYVKTGQHTFATPAASRPRGKGDPATNTGKVIYWTGNWNTIDAASRRVIDLNPAFVHQEADKINW